MELHTLYHSDMVYFSTTDYEDFLNKCQTLYEEVATEDWETYENLEDLPSIFENHAYHYTITDPKNLITSNLNNNLVNLYFKLQQYNPTINFDNGTALMLACNRLLNYHYDASIKYINDSKNEVSLLQEIVGTNGIEQLDFHKQFRSMYDISIY